MQESPQAEETGKSPEETGRSPEETGKSPGDEDLKSSSSSWESPKDKQSLGAEEEKTMPTTQDLFGDEDLDVSSDEDEEEELKVSILFGE